jgi:hypothetical protein
MPDVWWFVIWLGFIGWKWLVLIVLWEIRDELRKDAHDRP